MFCVLCVSDGVGRTGAFISTHAEMERMKAEAVVDLFQFVKGIRVQRPGMVANKVRSYIKYNNILLLIIQEQYEFCHQVLADFLDRFDTYANFKEIV